MLLNYPRFSGGYCSARWLVSLDGEYRMHDGCGNREPVEIPRPDRI